MSTYNVTNSLAPPATINLGDILVITSSGLIPPRLLLKGPPDLDVSSQFVVTHANRPLPGTNAVATDFTNTWTSSKRGNYELGIDNLGIAVFTFSVI